MRRLSCRYACIEELWKNNCIWNICIQFSPWKFTYFLNTTSIKWPPLLAKTKCAIFSVFWPNHFLVFHKSCVNFPFLKCGIFLINPIAEFEMNLTCHQNFLSKISFIAYHSSDLIVDKEHIDWLPLSRTQ